MVILDMQKSYNVRLDQIQAIDDQYVVQHVCSDAKWGICWEQIFQDLFL